MTNEYLRHKDLQERRASGNESTLEREVKQETPTRLRTIVMQSLEMLDHAAQCKRFDAGMLQIGQDVPSPFEQKLFEQEQPSLKPSPSDSPERSADDSEMNHFSHPGKLGGLERGKEYGVGAGFIPVTCNCGQTIDVRTDRAPPYTASSSTSSGTSSYLPHGRPGSPREIYRVRDEKMMDLPYGGTRRDLDKKDRAYAA